jgi:hypothetical protein
MNEGNAADQANANQEEVIDNDQEVTPEKTEVLTPEAEKEKAEKIQRDNAEASRIGRMVKKQWEREAEPLIDEIKNLRSTVERLTPKKEEGVFRTKPPIEGFPTTPEEFKAMKDWADGEDAKARAESQVTYERGYITSINQLREEGGELHAQIQELLTKNGSPYNKTHGTGRGDVDAALNYRIAHRDILANKIKTSGNPFKGNTSEVATGVSASSRVPASKTIGKTKFDDDQAEEFATFLNYSDEERAKIIARR